MFNAQTHAMAPKRKRKKSAPTPAATPTAAATAAVPSAAIATTATTGNRTADAATPTANDAAIAQALGAGTLQGNCEADDDTGTSDASDQGDDEESGCNSDHEAYDPTKQRSANRSKQYVSIAQASSSVIPSSHIVASDNGSGRCSGTTAATAAPATATTTASPSTTAAATAHTQLDPASRRVFVAPKCKKQYSVPLAVGVSLPALVAHLRSSLTKDGTDVAKGFWLWRSPSADWKYDSKQVIAAADASAWSALWYAQRCSK
jgi:hypothetical protein